MRVDVCVDVSVSIERGPPSNTCHPMSPLLWLVLIVSNTISKDMLRCLPDVALPLPGEAGLPTGVVSPAPTGGGRSTARELIR